MSTGKAANLCTGHPLTLYLDATRILSTHTLHSAFEFNFIVPEGQPNVSFMKDFSSAADFTAFVQGRNLFQMKRAVEGGKDEVVLLVTTLGEAVRAKVPGCYFLLEGSGMLLRDDV